MLRDDAATKRRAVAGRALASAGQRDLVMLGLGVEGQEAKLGVLDLADIG